MNEWSREQDEALEQHRWVRLVFETRRILTSGTKRSALTIGAASITLGLSRSVRTPCFFSTSLQSLSARSNQSRPYCRPGLNLQAARTTTHEDVHLERCGHGLDRASGRGRWFLRSCGRKRVMPKTRSNGLPVVIRSRRSGFLPICAGKIEDGDNWHDVRRLDSCVIDASEVIRRITFCQDTDNHAREFRVSTRLKRCGHLWAILKTNNRLPPALADLKEGFRLEWSPDFPHQKAIAVTTGKRATVVYMGEEANRYAD